MEGSEENFWNEDEIKYTQLINVPEENLLDRNMDNLNLQQEVDILPRMSQKSLSTSPVIHVIQNITLHPPFTTDEHNTENTKKDQDNCETANSSSNTEMKATEKNVDNIIVKFGEIVKVRSARCSYSDGRFAPIVFFRCQKLE